MGAQDTLPVAAAFTETVNAFFKGADPSKYVFNLTTSKNFILSVYGVNVKDNSSYYLLNVACLWFDFNMASTAIEISLDTEVDIPR